MDDRTLLERAAKAAGIDARYIESWGAYFIHRPHKLPGEWDRWHPLANDGQALRLAVKLRLEVDIHHTGIAVRTPNGLKVLVSAEDEPDDFAATRRAIVRAAAEIGGE